MTLASRPSPTPSSLIFSPTTPAPLPSGVDTDSNAIKFSEVELRGAILSGSLNGPSHTLPYSGAPTEPALDPPYYEQPVSPSLPVHSPPPRSASTSPATGDFSTPGYTLDAATRIQDFRALIDELRATLFHHESKEEFDAGNCDDDGDDERERVLRLQEDVMRKVRQLPENDAPYFDSLGGLPL